MNIYLQMAAMIYVGLLGGECIVFLFLHIVFSRLLFSNSLTHENARQKCIA